VTLKIRLHCDGCIDRIKRRIYKIKGAVFPPSDSPHDRKDRRPDRTFELTVSNSICRFQV